MSRSSLGPQFAESHATAAADIAARMLEDHASRFGAEVETLRLEMHNLKVERMGRFEAEVETLRLELHNLKVERMGRCEEQLFEHRHLIDSVTHDKQARLERSPCRLQRIELGFLECSPAGSAALSRPMFRRSPTVRVVPARDSRAQMLDESKRRLVHLEEEALKQRRGQEAMLHGLDEERHQRELRQDQVCECQDLQTRRFRLLAAGLKCMSACWLMAFMFWRTAAN